MTIKYYGLNLAADQSENEVNVGTSTALADATTADTDVGTVVADATDADTKVGTVVTDNTTTLTAIDAFAAAVTAITGDTYTSHQFTFGGSAGLTHAQVATTFALLNTAITDVLAAQTAANTAKTATALTKTDATTAKAATAAAKVSAAVPNDVTLEMDLSKAPGTQDMQLILDAFARRLIYSGPDDIGNV